MSENENNLDEVVAEVACEVRAEWPQPRCGSGISRTLTQGSRVARQLWALARNPVGIHVRSAGLRHLQPAAGSAAQGRLDFAVT